MKAPLGGMLLLAVPAGCGVAAVSTIRFAGESYGQLATIVMVGVAIPLSLGVGVVAFVGFLVARRVASRLSDAAAAAAGLVGAALLGGVSLAVAAATSPQFGPAGELWPCVGALGGALVGGAIVVFLRLGREPYEAAVPLEAD